MCTDTRSMKDVYENRAAKASHVISENCGNLELMGLLLRDPVVRPHRYSMSRWTREIGIWMGIGADRVKVVTMVLKQDLAVASAGVGVGLVVGLLACGAMNSIQIFGPRTAECLTFYRSFAVVAAYDDSRHVSAARRASHADPIRALRDE